MAECRPSWLCSRCQVRVSYAAGFAAPEQPAGWAVVDGEWRCRTCQREVFAEAAVADGTAASEAEGVAMYELTRDASQPNAVIGAAARLAPYKVSLVRKRLVDAGVIERLTPGRKPCPPKAPPPRLCKRCGEVEVAGRRRVCDGCKAKTRRMVPVERACDHCDRLYTATDPRSMYCSPQCRWAAKDRRRSPRVAAEGASRA